MKVKCLVRNPDEFLRETKRDIHKVPRNYDPALHPFEAQREYMRALNAAKLGRMFAKPFMGALDGHRDGVSCIAKHPKLLSRLASGAFDGEIKLWHIPTKNNFRSVQAHDGNVRGIVFTPDGSHFISVGDDKTIKTWDSEGPEIGEEDFPKNTLVTQDVVTGISHSNQNKVFATCGEVCQLWEETRSAPLKTLKWGSNTLHHIAFNPIETNILSTCASDRSIILYDTRDSGPVRKVVLTLRTNQVCWNPMEAFQFVSANEDYNLYTFDMRHLSEALIVHKSHVAAVTCVDFSPTGLEFVSGSYDKTLRIFPSKHKFSREVYHTKRMQKLTNVAWSLDDKYVMSASDEMNIRVWKARANEKLGVCLPREKNARKYNDSLLRKFNSFPEIKGIHTFRHVPRHVFTARREHYMIRQSKQRKLQNKIKHSKPGSVPVVRETKKSIVEEQQ